MLRVYTFVFRAICRGIFVGNRDGFCCRATCSDHLLTRIKRSRVTWRGKAIRCHGLDRLRVATRFFLSSPSFSFFFFFYRGIPLSGGRVHAPAMKRHLRLDLSKIHLRDGPLKVGGARKSTRTRAFPRRIFLSAHRRRRLDQSLTRKDKAFALDSNSLGLTLTTLLHLNCFFPPEFSPLQIRMVMRYEMARLVPPRVRPFWWLLQNK